jgi:hypothetical protein
VQGGAAEAAQRLGCACTGRVLESGRPYWAGGVGWVEPGHAVTVGSGGADWGQADGMRGGDVVYWTAVWSEPNNLCCFGGKNARGL